MKTKSLALSVASLLTFSNFSVHSQTVITFDDFDVSHDYSYTTIISNGYQGLNWSNLYVGNSFIESNNNGMSGYVYGMVSPSNFAYNADGYPAEIESATNFNFLSTYLTGAWNSNLNIEVEGFSGATLLYSNTVVAAATNATLFSFNYMDIDHLYFNSFDGDPAFDGPSRTPFVMDNFTVEFIPEPSTFLLAVGGVLILWPFIRRKRA